jgi:hypothetical protein
MAKLVACPACHDKLSGFDSRHPSKIVNGRYKQRTGLHSLARQINTQKNIRTNAKGHTFYSFPEITCNNTMFTSLG